MAVMQAVLCEDLRVQYNPQREKELFENHYFTNNEVYGEAERSFASDSGDWFLHGLLSDKRYGTCASMPYLYVAVGRRLGYPVSIACTHMHNYVYYDEGAGKHFNVEATENRGFVTPSDDEYRHPPWGAPAETNYFETHDLLRPISNQESMAHLLGDRAAVLRSAGRHDEEADAWANAARYFPDTPTWKGIAENMQHCAKSDEYHKWRDGVWKKLAARNIPRGPGMAFFLDMKIKLSLFMNESLDRKAIEKAADEFNKALDEYSKTATPPVLADPTASDKPADTSQTMYLQFHLTYGGLVSVPADFMPPFPRGIIPVDLQQRIHFAQPGDADTLLEMLWDGYAQAQAINQAKERAEVARIASGNPVLISEESIPPEFRQGVPMDLAMHLSGLHEAKDIVAEMWQYKLSHQRPNISEDPLAELNATLRQAGQPELPGMTMRSAMPNIPGINPVTGLPDMEAFTAQEMARDSFSNPRIQQQNAQMMQAVLQSMRPQENTLQPGFRLPYQVVPASVAAGNPGVANPMPSAGLPSSPLTPLPQSPITAPATKNYGP